MQRYLVYKLGNYPATYKEYKAKDLNDLRADLIKEYGNRKARLQLEIVTKNGSSGFLTVGGPYTSVWKTFSPKGLIKAYDVDSWTGEIIRWETH